MKKKYQIFTYGSYDLLSEDHEQVFAYERKLDGKTAVVVVNFSNTVAKWDAQNDMSVDTLILTNMKTTPKNSEEIY